MKRFAAPILLILALAACNDSPAPGVPGSAGSTSSEGGFVPAAASAPTADDQALATEAASKVTELAALAAQSPPPVAGTDYLLIPGGQPFQPVPGKIELAEVFAYTCSHCFAFEPLMRAWAKSLPDDVSVQYVPAVFGGPGDAYASAYYAAESLGVLDRTHDALFRAMHVDHSFKQGTADEIAAFMGHYGVDSAQFKSVMQSFAVLNKLKRSQQFMLQSKIDGTPTLVVNGKYHVLGKTRDDQVRIANQLIAQERAAGATATPAAAPAAATEPASAAAPAPTAAPEPAPAQ